MCQIVQSVPLPKQFTQRQINRMSRSTCEGHFLKVRDDLDAAEQPYLLELADRNLAIGLLKQELQPLSEQAQFALERREQAGKGRPGTAESLRLTRAVLEVERELLPLKSRLWRLEHERHHFVNECAGLHVQRLRNAHNALLARLHAKKRYLNTQARHEAILKPATVAQPVPESVSEQPTATPVLPSAQPADAPALPATTGELTRV